MRPLKVTSSRASVDRLAHRVEERRLGAEVAQEVLGHGERARRRPRREADEEHVGARPARQARRLRVEEDRAGARRGRARQSPPAPAPSRPGGAPARAGVGHGLERQGRGGRRALGGVARREPLEPRAEPRQLELAIERTGRRRGADPRGRGESSRGRCPALSRSGGRGAWPPSAWPAGRPRSPARRTTGSPDRQEHARIVSRARASSGPISSNRRSVSPTPPGWLS